MARDATSHAPKGHASLTRIRPRSYVTQSYFCSRSRCRKTRSVRQFVRERLCIDGGRLRRKMGMRRVSEAEALFGRSAQC